MRAETAGIEIATEWRPTERYRVRASYSFLDMNIHLHPKTLDIASQTIGGESPRHQFSLQVSADLSETIEMDAVVRYVDNLPSLDVDSYVNLDLRLGWKPSNNVEVALVGQNLLDARRTEFSPNFVPTVPVQTERGIYGEVTWRF